MGYGVLDFFTGGRDLSLADGLFPAHVPGQPASSLIPTVAQDKAHILTIQSPSTEAHWGDRNLICSTVERVMWLLILVMQTITHNYE